MPSYFERLREQRTREQARKQADAASTAAQARRDDELIRRKYEVFDREEAKARKVIDESAVEGVAEEFCHLTGISYHPSSEGGWKTVGDKYKDESFMECRQSLQYDYNTIPGVHIRNKHGYLEGDGTKYYKEIQIAAKPDGTIEVRGGFLGSTRISRERWQNDRHSIENALGKAHRFPSQGAEPWNRSPRETGR